MIEMGKKYRVRRKEFVEPVIFEVRPDYTFGRLGAYPVSWDSDTGEAHHVPNGFGGDKAAFDLIEVRPEVTERKCITIRQGKIGLWDACQYTDPTFVGVIDITHDGEKLIKVEIVNE